MGAAPDSWRGIARRWSRRLIGGAPGERDQCPACGSDALRDLDIMPQRGGTVALVCACGGCGLVFTNPQPTPEALTAFYSPDGAWGAPRREAVAAPRRLKGADASWVRRFDPVRDLLKVEAPPAGAAALDFGCGDGALLDELQACGWRTAGIEPASDVAFTRHERLDEVPTAPAFELIVAHHVLEHVPDPLTLLRRFAAAARSGGVLSVSVPRFDTLPVHRDYKYVLNGRAHIVAYTWPCLRLLLHRSGWLPVAEPPDEVGAVGGPRARARLRVLAQRAETAEPGDDDPAHAARAAIQGYYRARDPRPLLARLGCFRLAARRLERRWRREAAGRKAARRPGRVRA